jgi:Arc/MetJ family transcription regulator
MSTTIVVEDDLMEAAMEASGLDSKRAVVEEGLRLLVRLSDQARIKELWGRVHWKGDLEVSRKTRLSED